MLTFSSHLLPKKLADELCTAIGATQKPAKSDVNLPFFTITFPPTEKGLISSITVKSAMPLENAASSLLTFFLTLSSPDIFPLTQCMLVFIRQRITLTKAQEENIATALHEALLNALIHGNLGIDSQYNDAYKMFDHFEAISLLLLQKMELKAITLQIEFPQEGVVVSITDQGNGFSKNAIVPPGESSLHGRGMTIIRECCDTVDITDNGRTIIMRFASSNLPPNTPSSIIKSHILIVEDVAVNRAIITETLKRRGFTNLSFAIDGLEAYQKTLELKPDLVLLDLILPKMDGYEYCRRIRQHPELKELPVVIQTALLQDEQRSKAFACGASDLVTKPLNTYELTARLILHLERQELLRDLRTYQHRIQAEMEQARIMQNSILPGKNLLEELHARQGIAVHSLFRNSAEIGGDIWGVRLISDVECAVHIADFSGHGITAALNSFRLQTILQDMQTSLSDPAVILQKVNGKLCELLASDQFATMFYAIINIEKNQLTYAAAGSTHPLILRNRKNIEWLDGTGLPLGIYKDKTYIAHTIPFNRNDALFLYSDALIETRNNKGELFTPEMLEVNLPAQSSLLSFDQVQHKFYHHCNKGVEDDLTMVLLAREDK